MELLERQDIRVTQATISRDIKEMQLVKVRLFRVAIIMRCLFKRRTLKRNLNERLGCFCFAIQDKNTFLKVLPEMHQQSL